MEGELKFLLGLCHKAGKLVSGSETLEKALKNGDLKLVIVSADASGNTKKKFVNKCFFYHVPCFCVLDREGLSKAIGKNNRTAVGITDEGLSAKISGVIRKGMQTDCLSDWT